MSWIDPRWTWSGTKTPAPHWSFSPWRPSEEAEMTCEQCVHCADAIDLLREIAVSDPVDNARDPDRNRRIARDFIIALMEETPE